MTRDDFDDYIRTTNDVYGYLGCQGMTGMTRDA